MLDETRAEVASNMFRYGVPELGPGIVKSFEVSGESSYCVKAGTSLEIRNAADRRGKPIALEGKSDWFVATSDPPDLATIRELIAQVTSPLDDSLAALGRPITLTIGVKDTDLAKSVTLSQSLTCSERVGFAGEKGESGRGGTAGDTFGTGGTGSGGGSGGVGPSVEAEAAFVTYKGKHYLAVATTLDGKHRFALVDPNGGRITVTATGGDGGDGGDGGRGGDAETSTGGSATCLDIKAGTGGIGGTGGTGGPGGRLTLRGPRDAIDAVTIDVAGGDGGVGGSGGSGGSGVNRGCLASSGDRGAKGAAGASGPKGTSFTEVAPASSLRVLREWIATNPEVRLEGDSKKK